MSRHKSRVAVAAIIGLLMGACLMATLAPLALYATSVAVLGLPHVLAELRYIDARFHKRLGARYVFILLFLLGGLVLARLVSVTGTANMRDGAVAELITLAALAAGFPCS